MPRHFSAHPTFPWNSRASRSFIFSLESRLSEVAITIYSFLISYACFHKDLAYLLVNIYCLIVALSILSLQRVLLVLYVWQLIRFESEAKPTDTD
jgi:hypothetical protein